MLSRQIRTKQKTVCFLFCPNLPGPFSILSQFGGTVIILSVSLTIESALVKDTDSMITVPPNWDKIENGLVLDTDHMLSQQTGTKVKNAFL